MFPTSTFYLWGVTASVVAQARRPWFETYFVNESFLKLSRSVCFFMQPSEDGSTDSRLAGSCLLLVKDHTQFTDNSSTLESKMQQMILSLIKSENESMKVECSIIFLNLIFMHSKYSFITVL